MQEHFREDAASTVGGDVRPLQGYVMSSTVSRLVKIGITRNAEKRMRDLRVSSGVPVVLELLVDPGRWSAGKVERTAHGILSKHRTCGEWFSVGTDRAIGAVYKAMKRLEAARPKPARCRGRPKGSLNRKPRPAAIEVGELSQPSDPRGRVLRYRDKSRVVKGGKGKRRGRGRPAGKGKLQVTAVLLYQIRSLAQEGHSRNAAAQKMDVGAATLSRFLKTEPLAKKAWDEGEKRWDAKRGRMALARLQAAAPQIDGVAKLPRGRPSGSQNRIYPRAPKKFVATEQRNSESG